MPALEGINFTPHAAQRPVWTSDARFRVIAAGRRSGKTTLAAASMIDAAADGGPGWRGWWVTPSHDIADTGYQLIDNALNDAAVAERKLSPPRSLTLVNGSTVGFRTTAGGANVSVGLDYVIIDEAAKGVPEQAWTQELRPTLSDRDGDALFISTPDGRGWFYDWWQRGQSTDYPDVGSWRWSTYDNPHVPDSEVDAAQNELPRRIFEQEYLAKFVDDTGGVFTLDGATEQYALPDGVDPPEHSTPPYRVGADLARSEDYLAIVALDATGVVTHLTRKRDLTWPQIQHRIEAVARGHDDARVAIDATRDNKLVSDLETAGIAIEPVHFSAQRKQALVENLAAGMESGEVTIPSETMLATELAVFEYTTTRAGNIRYGAPDGHHDDTVDALCMAYDLRGGSTPATTASFGSGPEHSATGDADFSDSEIGQALSEYRQQQRGPFG